MNKTVQIIVSLVLLAAALAAAVYFLVQSHMDNISDPKQSPDVLREEAYKDNPDMPFTGTTTPEPENDPVIEEEVVETPTQEEVVVEVPSNEPEPTTTPEVVEEETPEIPEEAPTTTVEELTETTLSAFTPITHEECLENLAASPFFIDPAAVITREEREYRENGDDETAGLLREIACHPQAIWLTWKDAESMRARVDDLAGQAEDLDKIPVFVIYNSPDFHTTKWWVGNEGEDYLNWIEEVAKGVGTRNAWFILEPDALGLSTDYSPEDRTYRLNELSSAVSLLKEHAPNARVYMDAGHSKWKTPERFAELLTAAGIGKADGFALNISNYQSLEDEIARGTALSALVDDKHFIIDTARNGNGAPIDNEWCNARGRALGEAPELNPNASPLVDAFFWIKPPGESDGTCNGGPTPGQFWLEYALELVRNARGIDT